MDVRSSKVFVAQDEIDTGRSELLLERRGELLVSPLVDQLRLAVYERNVLGLGTRKVADQFLRPRSTR